ncbi:uncharacterized protein LOC118404920 [Branchiostoma floridae]|uniref:Uncharacterized protein LOC118404920 n=1 Tax=Branchiostoma floridae TaxID=7739 RepID=A0A9J7HMX3_BRAFL|nr:uncharacterized protein LOC118404920 [Branchiostoma floridae]
MMDQSSTPNKKRPRFEDRGNPPSTSSNIYPTSPPSTSNIYPTSPPSTSNIYPAGHNNTYFPSPMYQFSPYVNHGISSPLLHPPSPAYHMSPGVNAQFHQPSTSYAQPTVSLQAFQQMEDKLKAQLSKMNTLVEEQQKEIHDLKTYSKASIDAVKNTAQKEVKSLVMKDTILTYNAETATDIANMTPQSMKEQVKDEAPVFFELLENCIKSDVPGDKDTSMLAFLNLCSIANNRSKRANAIQMITTLSLISRSTNVQVISMLNSMGVASSYKAAWNFLSNFAEMQGAKHLDNSKPCIVFFDNVNILKRVGHVRMGKQNEMFNWTSRLAVVVEHEDPSASREPQGKREDLSDADILADSNDISDLKSRLKNQVKAIIVEHFPSFHQFKDSVRAPSSPLPVKKSSITPLPLMDKDESKKDDTIQILLKFAEELQLSDNMKDQAVVGDQATCKNIRGGRGWREGEEDPVQLLQWAKESPGDFHFVWEALKTATLCCWGLATEAGSLSQIRVAINRMRADKECKNFQVSDEFFCHVSKGHILAALTVFLGLESPTWRSLNPEWLDPRAVARERLYDNKWLANFLTRGKQDISDDTEPPESPDADDGETDEDSAEQVEVRDEEDPEWEEIEDADLINLDLA